jgi:hypothetical protein
MQGLYALLMHWPPGQPQVLANDFISMITFLVIAVVICLFTGFSLPYLLKSAGGGAAFPTLILIAMYAVSPGVQHLFAIEVVEYIAMVGATYGALLSLHTLFKGP